MHAAIGKCLRAGYTLRCAKTAYEAIQQHAIKEPPAETDYAAVFLAACSRVRNLLQAIIEQFKEQNINIPYFLSTNPLFQLQEAPRPE